jgi:hypothetical protein
MRLFVKILRRLIAGILCAWGALIVLGFSIEMYEGSSERPLWDDLLTVTVAGLIPMGGGLMLIFKGSSKQGTSR